MSEAFDGSFVARLVSWVFSCEIPVWLENVTNLCLSCWAQEFVSYARVGGKGQCPQSFQRKCHLCPLACSWRWGGNLICACLWRWIIERASGANGTPRPVTVRGFSAERLKPGNKPLQCKTDTGRPTSLECVPVTIATTWNKKWEIISSWPMLKNISRACWTVYSSFDVLHYGTLVLLQGYYYY